MSVWAVPVKEKIKVTDKRIALLQTTGGCADNPWSVACCLEWLVGLKSSQRTWARNLRLPVRYSKHWVLLNGYQLVMNAFDSTVEHVVPRLTCRYFVWVHSHWVRSPAMIAMLCRSLRPTLPRSITISVAQYSIIKPMFASFHGYEQLFWSAMTDISPYVSTDSEFQFSIQQY